MNVLVAYYTMQGRSGKASEELAKYLSAKGYKTAIEKIVPKPDYSKLKAYIFGCMQAMRKQTIRLEPPKNNPASFDIIAVICPTWAFTCAPPGYSYISNLPEAKRGQKALAITINQGTPGDGPKALAGFFEKKGYGVLAAFTLQDPLKIGETLAKEAKL
jgi:flavodoxin